MSINLEKRVFTTDETDFMLKLNCGLRIEENRAVADMSASENV